MNWIRTSIVLLVPVCLLAAFPAAAESRPKLIIDADTANEIDDMYAIVRMLHQDKFDVVGLNSTQWQHRLSGPNTAAESHQINRKLLELLDREDLPLNLGSNEPVGMPWGGDEPRDSAATRFIIDRARALPEGEQIIVMCIGATTNLASAIRLAPDIVPRLRVYLMGFKFDPGTRVWNKSEFNVRRDLNAADVVLNTAGLEVHVMSGTVSHPYTFPRDETFRRHERMGKLGAYLTERWRERFAEFENWVMWDLALVEAMLNPGMARESLTMTPPENTQRQIHVYDWIDVEAMRADYWQAVLD